MQFFPSVRAHFLVVYYATSLRLATASVTFDIVASPGLVKDGSETVQIKTLNLTTEMTGVRCGSTKTLRFTKVFQFLV